MDDLDPSMAGMLVAFIKDWTDRYPFKAERKGGSLYPQIRQFFITTQYTPEQLWPDKQDQNGNTIHNIDRDAVIRRCKLMEFHSEEHREHKNVTNIDDPSTWALDNQYCIKNAPKWI